MVCPVCEQPECPRSKGGERAEPGSHPDRPSPGQRIYRGYCEWAIHPDEAVLILHQGYVLVDGVRRRAGLVHNDAYATIVQVDASDLAYVLDEQFRESTAADKPAVEAKP
jgi:ribosomal protein S4E